MKGNNIALLTLAYLLISGRKRGQRVDIYRIFEENFGVRLAQMQDNLVASRQVKAEIETLRTETANYNSQAAGHAGDAEYAAYLSSVGSLAWYGIEFDTTVASTALTRIGNLDLHRELPYHRRIRHCLLLDNGTVNYYTHANNQGLKQNGQPADLTGADGQRMVEFPESYWRFEVEGTKRRVKLSEYPLPGFFRVAPFYVSPDGACIHRPSGKLASVVNSSPDYRGGNNNAAWDAEYRTLLQREVTSIDLTSLRAASRLRGPGWEQYTIQVHEVISWLVRVEYANFDNQIAFNPTLNGNGFRQGGLGSGVSTLSSGEWTTFNNNNPYLPTGIGVEMGNNTGIVSYNMPIEYKNPIVQVSVPVWRGLANPFGYIWRWVDGVLIRVEPSGSGGKSSVFLTDNPSKFSSVSVGDYTLKGETARASGYIKTILFDDRGGIVPETVGASSLTYLSDYFYVNIQSSGVVLYGCRFGGGSDTGVNAGLSCMSSSYAPSGVSPAYGGRLCFLGS